MDPLQQNNQPSPGVDPNGPQPGAVPLPDAPVASVSDPQINPVVNPTMPADPSPAVDPNLVASATTISGPVDSPVASAPVEPLAAPIEPTQDAAAPAPAGPVGLPSANNVTPSSGALPPVPISDGSKSKMPLVLIGVAVVLILLILALVLL